MGELGRKFRQHMVLRGFAEATKESYEHALVDLVRAYDGKSPDLLTNEQIQAHVARLTSERHLAWTTINVYVSAYKIFFHDLLQRPDISAPASELFGRFYRHDRYL